MGMYAPPQQPPPQSNNYNNYNNSYFGAPNASFGIQATGIFGPQAQPPSNASMNQVNRSIHHPFRFLFTKSESKTYITECEQNSKICICVFLYSH